MLRGRPVWAIGSPPEQRGRCSGGDGPDRRTSGCRGGGRGRRGRGGWPVKSPCSADLYTPPLSGSTARSSSQPSVRSPSFLESAMRQSAIEHVESKNLRKDVTEFRTGDSVRVH